MELSGAKLLRREKPKADESFLGYLVRLTELNGYETPSLILSLSGIDYMELQWKFAFVFSRSEQLKRFAQITGNSESELLPFLYLPAPTSPHNGYSTEFTFYGAFVNRSIIRPHCPKVCPNCLIESGYCLRIWDCSLVTACPVHEYMLIDTCPRCKSCIRCVRNSLSVCACGCDWREIALELVSEDEVAVSRQVYQLCGLLSPQADSAEKVRKNPLYGLDLRDLAIVLTFIAGLYGDISWATGRPSKSIKWLNKDLHRLYSRAYTVFENWPSNFHRFLSEQSVGESKLDPYDGKLDTALKREFHSIYKGLYKKLPGSQYDFLRNSFVDFLIKRWKTDSLQSFKADLQSVHNKKDSYISLRAARRLLSINHQSLFKLIKTGEIEFIIQNHDSSLLYMLRLSDIKKLRSSSGQPTYMPL